MKILALEFPPVSHLFEWPDFAFEGTPLAMNKTVLVYLFAFALTLGLFLLAGSKKGLVPRGISHVAEGGINFVEDSIVCLLYTSPSPRDRPLSRMPSSA